MPAVNIPNPAELMNESLAWDVAHSQQHLQDYYHTHRETLTSDQVLDIGMQIGVAATKAELSWHDQQAAAAQYDTGPAAFAPAAEVPGEPVELPEAGSTTVLSAAQTALAAEAEAAKPPAEKARTRPEVKKLSETGVETVADRLVQRWAMFVEFPDPKGRNVTVQNDKDKALGKRIKEYGLSVPTFEPVDGLDGDVSESVRFDLVPGQTYTPFTGHRLKEDTSWGDDVVLMRYAAPVNAFEGEAEGVVVLNAIMPRTSAEQLQARLAEDKNPELAAAMLGSFIAANIPERSLSAVSMRVMPNNQELQGKEWVDVPHKMRIRSELHPTLNEGTGEMGPEDVVVNIPPLAAEAPAEPDDKKPGKGGGVRGRVGRALIHGIGNSGE